MKNTMSRLRIIPVCLVIILLLTACSEREEPKPDGANGENGGDLFNLTILHTNDVHARVMQFNEWGNTCGEDEAMEGECFGGVARRTTVINRMRERYPNSILVDAGDQFQGTLFYTQYLGLEAQTFMNLMGYDVMTLGNHEFDNGPEVLSDFIDGLEFPVVSSNIDVDNEPLLNTLIERFEIIEIDGHEIGILGFTTEDVPLIAQPGPNLIFNDIESSVRQAVTDLQDRGVNIIIALSHAGLGRDMEIAASVEGIDVIVGGHTHSLLSNTDENAEGPYPVMMTSPADEPVLIVTAQSWGKYLGNLHVMFDAGGVATEWSGDPILLDSTVPEHEGTGDLVAEMYREVEPLYILVVGESMVDLIGAEEICRHGECNLGNLICDVLLWETQRAGIQIALFNGGGIRSGIPAGEITLAQVLEVLPFGDTLATFDMRGSDIYELLEYAVSRAEDPLNEGTGRFLQVAGLRFTWNPDKQVGSRILGIEVQNEDGNYSPIEDETIYKIATLLYIREGGDGYTILEEKAIDPYDFGRVISDILVDYLIEYSPIAPKIEGRIKSSS